MIDPKVVFELVAGRWRVEYRTQWTDEWQTHRYHHTLEEACEDAPEMTNNDSDGGYRVVDTQPEAVVEAAPFRWRVDVTAPIKRWVPHALFNSRESAEAYAEALVKRSDQRNLMARVVDTNPSDPVTVAIFEEDNV